MSFSIKIDRVAQTVVLGTREQVVLREIDRSMAQRMWQEWREGTASRGEVLVAGASFRAGSCQWPSMSQEELAKYTYAEGDVPDPLTGEQEPRDVPPLQQEEFAHLVESAIGRGLSLFPTPDREIAFRDLDPMEDAKVYQLLYMLIINNATNFKIRGSPAFQERVYKAFQRMLETRVGRNQLLLLLRHGAQIDIAPDEKSGAGKTTIFLAEDASLKEIVWVVDAEGNIYPEEMSDDATLYHEMRHVLGNLADEDLSQRKRNTQVKGWTNLNEKEAIFFENIYRRSRRLLMRINHLGGSDRGKTEQERFKGGFLGACKKGDESWVRALLQRIADPLSEKASLRACALAIESKNIQVLIALFQSPKLFLSPANKLRVMMDVSRAMSTSSSSLLMPFLNPDGAAGA